MPVFQGGRVWLGGQADLESNAIKPQQNACMVITPKGGSKKCWKRTYSSSNAGFACARKEMK